jgi:CheY-like chemotaxis protein
MPGKRVLLVDDDADQAKTLMMLLADGGHHVEYATSALYAITIADQFQPDVVFLDIAMPRIDGYEALRKLKQRFANARFYAISGRSGAEARRKSVAAGFDDHLVKPVEIATIERLLADD